MGVASRGSRARGPASTLASLRTLAGGLPGLKTMEVLIIIRCWAWEWCRAAYEAVPDVMVAVAVLN